MIDIPIFLILFVFVTIIFGTFLAMFMIRSVIMNRLEHPSYTPNNPEPNFVPETPPSVIPASPLPQTATNTINYTPLPPALNPTPPVPPHH